VVAGVGRWSNHCLYFLAGEVDERKYEVAEMHMKYNGMHIQSDIAGLPEALQPLPTLSDWGV
jgi:hypothetical protein